MSDDDPLESEHAFLRRLCGRLNARNAGPQRSLDLLVDAGDDAAVFGTTGRPLAVTTDSLVEGVHFRREWLSASELGRRAVAVNVSDLAAMAAAPRALLAAVSLPPSNSSEWLDGLLDGCAEAAEEAGAALVGGNLARASEATITITAIGEIPGRRLERGGAKPGDHLVVTGTLGDAAAALATWLDGGVPADELRARWIAPSARVQAGIVLAEAGAHAAIDLSDGLLADARHLCRASGVGARLRHADLPRTESVRRLDEEGDHFAARGGEDYELLFACPASVVAQLDELADRASVPLTVIGECTEDAGEVHLVDPDGRPLTVGHGFDHFARGASR